MLFVIRFHDHSDREDRRQANMAAHLDFLDDLAPQIRAAGPLSGPDGAPAGGMWVMEADSVDAVQAAIRADPLFAAGLRDRWEVLSWRQVHRDGQRQD